MTDQPAVMLEGAFQSFIRLRRIQQGFREPPLSLG